MLQLLGQRSRSHTGRHTQPNVSAYCSTVSLVEHPSSPPIPRFRASPLSSTIRPRASTIRLGHPHSTSRSLGPGYMFGTTIVEDGERPVVAMGADHPLHQRTVDAARVRVSSRWLCAAAFPKYARICITPPTQHADSDPLTDVAVTDRAACGFVIVAYGDASSALSCVAPVPYRVRVAVEEEEERAPRCSGSPASRPGSSINLCMALAGTTGPNRLEQELPARDIHSLTLLERIPPGISPIRSASTARLPLPPSPSGQWMCLDRWCVYTTTQSHGRVAC